MPVGTITQALRLIKPGAETQVQSSYTYYLTPSMPPSYVSVPPTDYLMSAGGSQYSYASVDFVNMTSGTRSSFLALITGRMADLTDTAFSPLGSFSADILISGLSRQLFQGNLWIYGFATYPNATSTSLDLDILLTQDGVADFDASVAHEIMHSLGLLDVGPATGGGLYSGDENTGQYTMMAYNPHQGESRSVIELQLYDVAAIQALHGRDDEYNVTDTPITQFTETWGAYSGEDRIFCIWDAGGQDTIDAHSLAHAALIDLRPGYFSSIGPKSNFVITAGTTPAAPNSYYGKLNISIAYGAYIENAKGTDEGDLIIGNLLSNKLEGRDGDDVIYAEGTDSLYDAGDGVDNYQQIITTGSHVEAAPSTIQAYLDDKTKQSDHLLGGDGDDHLRGGRGDDLIEGGEDDDFIRGGGGNDEIWGGDRDDDEGTGDGTDTVDYSLVAHGIVITFNGFNGNSTLGVVDGEGGVDTLRSIEMIMGTNVADRFVYGGDLPNNLRLTIDAAGGQDEFVDLSSSSTPLLFANTSTGGTITQAGSSGRITLVHFHTQIIGSAYDDTITDDSSGEKHIDGGAGDDVITIAGDGPAMLRGGAGDDILTGGDGNDLIVGDWYLGVVQTANELNGGGGADHIVSTGQDRIDGGDGHDFIEMYAFSSNSSVRGGGGNDLIDASRIGSFSLIFGANDGHDSLIWQGYSSSNSNYPNIIFDGIDLSDVTIIWQVTPDGMGNFSGVGDAVVTIESTGASIFIPNVYGQVRFNGNVADTGAPNRLWIGINDGGGFYQFHHPEIRIVIGDVSGYATAAADYAAAVAAAPGANQGTSGDDDMRGSRGDDEIAGGNGNDSFHASGGSDRIDGGAGTDVLSLFSGIAGFLITYDAMAGETVVQDTTGLEGTIRLKSIEKIYFATDNAEYELGDLVGFWGTPGDDALVEGNGNDNQIHGLAGADLLRGLAGNDTLDGGAGNDLLVGGTGADLMQGGTGDDTYYVDDAGDQISELAGEGNDRVAATASYVLAAGAAIETLDAEDSAAAIAMDLTGNDFVNVVIGNNGINLLFGNGGNDQLIGNGGNDFLVGGSGADLMYGGTGNDTFYVDHIGDRAYELAGEGTDRIATLITYTLDDASEVELLEATNTLDTNAMDLTGSNSANQIIGNAGVNLLFGLNGNDQLIGNGGNDYLVGGAGADLMYGGAGDDTYYVDAAGDQANEAAGEGTDRIATSISYALQSNSEVELLEAENLAGTNAMNLSGSDSANAIIGNAGVNVLRGEGGNDTLTGANGNDYLVGGAGNDAMYGGAGDDTYYVDAAGDVVSESAGEGNDRIATAVSYTLAAGSAVELLDAENSAGTGAMNLTGNAFGNTISANAGVNVLDGKGGNDVLAGLGGADTFAFTSALGAGNVDAIADFAHGTDKIALDDAVFTALSPGALASGAFVIGSAAADADDRIVYNSATGALYYDADGNGAGAAVQFATMSGLPTLSASDFTVI